MNDYTAELLALATRQQELIGNTGMFANLDNVGTDGVLGSNSTPPVFVKRPWLDPPEGASPFDFQDGTALPAIAGTTNVATLVCPEGYDGVINAINCNFTGGGFLQFSGDITWRLTADGRPIRNFENVKNEKGTVTIGRVVSPIRLFAGVTYVWQVTHVANVALSGQVICGMSGYYYPKTY